MAIEICGKCGAKNRVDERVTFVGKRPVCGRCGSPLTGETEAGAYAPPGDARGGAGAESASAAGDSTKPREVSDATFQSEVISRSARVPVLLDCWAPWCGPCRMVAPVLDELAAEADGRYEIAKLNVDHNKRTAAELGIQSIPTLFIFKNGAAVERIVGAQSKQVLAARLAAHT